MSRLNLEISLIGHHVSLVPMREEHSEALLRAANEARGSFAYTNVPQNLAAMNTYLHYAIALRDSGEAAAFVSVDNRTNQVVGTTRFMALERWGTSETPSVLEIGGTWLAESAQRSGINTEAKLLMLSHAFETWKVLRVTFKTDARNERSRRNIERVGAKFDGVLRAHMPAIDGGVRNSAYYSLLRDEWPSAKVELESKLRF